MRQNIAPASSSAASINEAPGTAAHLHLSPEIATSSNCGPHAATTPMSQHGQTTSSGSSSAELPDALHGVQGEEEDGDDDDDDDDDDDMADVDLEDGGVALNETYMDDSDIISPLTGSAMDNTPFPAGSSNAGEMDDSNSLDLEPEWLHMHPYDPAYYFNMPPSPTFAHQPAPGGAAVAHLVAQLPASAQHLLPNAQPQQALPVQQEELPGQQLLHQQQQFINTWLEDELGDLHGAPPLSNPNHLTLGPDNHSVADFLRSWARVGRSRDGQPVPHIGELNALVRDKDKSRIEFDELRGDAHDLQGINWAELGVPRSKARERRRATYKNYVNKAGSDEWHPSLPDRFAIPRDNYFRFRSMDIRRDTRLLHFQLRNILGCASRTRAFFPSLNAVAELDPTTGRAKKAMDFGPHSDVQVSTVAATDKILVAGSFLGDYRYRNLDSEDRAYTEGKLTDHISGITNHVQIHSARRSSAPIAAFASNDYGFRAVDLTTNRLLFESMYKYPLNCSAISTDQRLRVMVGDHTNVLITDAETGEIVQDLSGHRDFGFACDWAPDGWTVATGFQDKSVRIWDARRWTNNHDGAGAPIAVLRMDMSGARSLRFSPLGSGKRLLVAAEEADVINIFDAQTFNTQQKIETFGEIGGTAFADDGRVLMALNTDPTRGGVMHFDRCDAGAEDAFITRNIGFHQRPSLESAKYDWAQSTAEILARPESLETMTERKRSAMIYSNLDPF